MNDLKFAVRQLLKHPGFTVHPQQCCFGRPGHSRQYRYAGRAVAALTVAPQLGISTINS